MRYAVAALLALLFVLPAPCESVELRVAYTWTPVRDCPTNICLWQRVGVGQWEQIGGYDTETDLYRPRFGPGDWGPPCPPPVAVPERHRKRRRPRRPRVNYGVETEKLTAPATPRYTDQDGRELSRKAGTRAITAPLPDDGARPHATIKGGAAAQRAAVLRELAPYAGKARVHAYSESDWVVSRGGFAPGFQLYFQDADGKVLSRTPNPAPGDAGTVAGKLWQPDPSYDPARDPDLTSAVSPWIPAVAGGSVGLAFAAFGIVSMLAASARAAATRE